MWFLSVQCGTDHYGDIVMQPKHIASQWWYPVPCINILYYCIYIYESEIPRHVLFAYVAMSHGYWNPKVCHVAGVIATIRYFFLAHIYIIYYYIAAAFPTHPNMLSTVQQTSSKRAGASEAAVRLAAQASEPRRAAGLLVPWSRVLHGLEINSKTCQ